MTEHRDSNGRKILRGDEVDRNGRGEAWLVVGFPSADQVRVVDKHGNKGTFYANRGLQHLTITHRMGQPIDTLHPLCYGADGGLMEWGDELEHAQNRKALGRIIAFTAGGSPVAQAPSGNVAALDRTLIRVRRPAITLTVTADPSAANAIRDVPGVRKVEEVR
jgi:hypothetical protein